MKKSTLLLVGILIPVLTFLICRRPSTLTTTPIFTNTTIHAWLKGQPPLVEESTRIGLEGVEPAERHNLEIMRRYQERWERVRGLQIPFEPSLKPSLLEQVLDRER